MNSKRQVMVKLGHVVQIRVCRLTQTWCLISLINNNNKNNNKTKERTLQMPKNNFIKCSPAL